MFNFKSTFILLIAWAFPIQPMWAASEQVFDSHQPVPAFEIENIEFTIPNLSEIPYDIGLSLLYFVSDRGRTPLLAIATCPDERGRTDWMAVWNLTDSDPGVVSNLKAFVPHLWRARSNKEDAENVGKSDFPTPYLSWNDRGGESKKKMTWAATRRVMDIANLFNPGRFMYRNISHFRQDLADRRFHQTYTKVRIYEDLARNHPSPGNLSAPAVLNLKFHLLMTRSAFGGLVNDLKMIEVVDHFESEMREQAAKVLSYLHTEANFAHLRLSEIEYALPNRPPLARIALLSIRGTDLPEPLPARPNGNFLDLNFDPYRDPHVAELMKRNPEDDIPLALYVLNSDFQLRPILAVDFFDHGNVTRREATSALKLTVDHLLAVQSIPFLFRAVERFANYSIHRKDWARFSKNSTSPGVEPLRLFSGLGWHLDDDTNQMIAGSLDRRVVNPLASATERYDSVAAKNYAAMRLDQDRHLKLQLRRLYEDRVRDSLGLPNRVVFAEDLELYERRRRLEASLQLIRQFNRETHLPGYSWERLASAWEVVAENLGKTNSLDREAARFLERVDVLYPQDVPASYRHLFASWLERPAESVPVALDRGLLPEDTKTTAY